MDEKFIHYKNSITSLNQSWVILCELEANESESVISWAAYRMALIEYCKPFKSSYDINQKRQILPAPKLDKEKMALHTKILHLRDKALVHSDHSVLDAKVSYDKSAKFPVPMICLNILDDLPKVSDIRNLVEIVLDELYLEQATYDQYYASNH